MFRTAVGGETAKSLLQGEQGLIEKLDMRVEPLVHLDGFVHFKLPVDYGKAFANLKICGRTPDGVRSLYAAASKNHISGLDYASRCILDLEDAREIVGIKGDKDFAALDNFGELLSLKLDQGELRASGILNLKALTAYDEKTLHEKIAEMQAQLLRTVGLGDPQKAMEITLKSPKWLKAAADYTAWLFGLVKERLEAESPNNEQDTRKLIELYSGIW